MKSVCAQEDDDLQVGLANVEIRSTGCCASAVVEDRLFRRAPTRLASVCTGEALMPTHPYISGPGSVEQMIGFLRKNFPVTVTSETVKKFGLAPNNESYVINALQFIGVIDGDSKRTIKGHDAFVLGDDEFSKSFESLVREAYKDLFDTRGEDAWSMNRRDLITYFRTTDKTSEVIGGRQAGLFQTFASLAGHPALASAGGPVSNKSGPKQKTRQAKTRVSKAINVDPVLGSPIEDVKVNESRSSMALTVRIEVNLPADGTQDTYDAIFKSIRMNLIND